MISYPTPDEYQEAIQVPEFAFVDELLRRGTVEVDQRGIPIPLSGGFALTYMITAAGKRYAVRCFQRSIGDVKGRYVALERALNELSSPHFVDFRYQPEGLIVRSKRYPVVVMDWADGPTLGEYLNINYARPHAIAGLRQKVRDLELALRTNSIAHGDLQHGNIIVGNTLRLVDYDGMYVRSFEVADGTELGHRNFQHPKRTIRDFGPAIDRFSFILIDLSLSLLEIAPQLFETFHTGENIIFTREDLEHPDKSVAMAEARSVARLAGRIDDLAALCGSSVSLVPTLANFIMRRGFPFPQSRQRINDTSAHSSTPPDGLVVDEVSVAKEPSSAEPNEPTAFSDSEELEIQHDDYAEHAHMYRHFKQILQGVAFFVAVALILLAYFFSDFFRAPLPSGLPRQP